MPPLWKYRRRCLMGKEYISSQESMESKPALSYRQVPINAWEGLIWRNGGMGGREIYMKSCRP